jgi:microcystin-dependent protein
MAGTINLALTQQLDEFGAPLSGGQLYIIQAGTVSTPQNPFQDTGLSIVMPNPITLDAAGRIPQFFLADGQIKVRLQDKNGIVKFVQDNLLVIGPSAGGGGGGAVDPTTVMATGDLKVRYDTAIISGFVRCNGKTIGSASSGATELADPSAQALFNHLWLKDPNLVVTPGGRGANGAADWAANKQITLPDWRGRALAALDDMGNTAAGRLTATYFGVSATVLGAASGAESYTIANSNLPPYTPAGTVTTTTTGTVNGLGSTPNQVGTLSGFTDAIVGSGYAPSITASSSSTFTGTPQGGSSTPFSKCQPTMLATVYLKL